MFTLCRPFSPFMRKNVTPKQRFPLAITWWKDSKLQDILLVCLVVGAAQYEILSTLNICCVYDRASNLKAFKISYTMNQYRANYA